MSELPPQRSAFLAAEGDAYFARNAEGHSDLSRAASIDPLLAAYRTLDLTPATVLEIGASDGWRLECMRRERPGAAYHGVDPSGTAVETGRSSYPELHLAVGTADDLPHDDASMDLVTFGFCLYLCDRSDLFRIAAEADRVLAAHGTIAIYDFNADPPYRNPYMDRAGLASFKMEYARLFTWSPAYSVLHHEVFPHPTADGERPASWTVDDLTAVTVLRKDVAAGWPEPTHEG